MKKILSILLALSIACGSVMLTSCGDDEKEDDDDKSTSDEEKDEDDEDEDDDKSKDDEDDDKSKDDEDESSKDDEDESSKDEDESSKDDEDESSKDEDKSSKDEEDESSDDEGDEGEETYEYEYLDTFSDLTIEIFGETYSWPFTAEPFCDYYEIDGSEMIAADDWDWYYDDATEVDFYNPSSDEETAIADCYVDYVYTEESTDVFEFTVNGVGVGSSVDDINDAFGTEFTISNGYVCIEDDENWSNYFYFDLADDVVTGVSAYCADDYFSSGDEGEGGSTDADYVGGDTVSVDAVTFTVPEGFSGEVGEDYASFMSDDMYSAIEMSVSDDDESIDDYPQEWFEEEMSYLADEIKDATYEVGTLGDADTIYYSAVLSVEGIDMPMTFYIIFTDAEDYAFSAYAYENNTDFMDELISSIELN